MFNSSEETEPEKTKMYRVIKKNKGSEEVEIVASDRAGAPLTKEQADRIAERCTLAETDDQVTYEVEQF